MPPLRKTKDNMPALDIPATPEMVTEAPASTYRVAGSANPSEAVLHALQESSYTWRTIDGIANDTGLDREQVLYILEHDLGNAIVRAAKPDKNGRSLFALKDKYEAARSFGNKVLTVLSDRIR